MKYVWIKEGLWNVRQFPVSCVSVIMNCRSVEIDRKEVPPKSKRVQFPGK